MKSKKRKKDHVNLTDIPSSWMPTLNLRSINPNYIPFTKWPEDVYGGNIHIDENGSHREVFHR